MMPSQITEFNIKSHNMAAIFSTDVCTVGDLDLFRGRSDVVLMIKYEEYLKYLREYALPNHDTSSCIYIVAAMFNASADTLLDLGNQLLCDMVFRLDLAQAILKDLSLTAVHQRAPSKIGWTAPFTSDNDSLSTEQKSQCHSCNNEYYGFCSAQLANRGYKLPDMDSTNMLAHVTARELVQTGFLIRKGTYIPLWKYSTQGG